MKMLEIIVPEAIIPSLQATTRDDAITEMVDALVSAGAIDTSLRDEFIKSIIERESHASTGLGKGVAIPHVKHEQITELKATVAISHSGVDFRSLDKQPVYTIFLLLSPQSRPEDHLNAMQTIFGNLSQETFRRFLRQAKTTEDVMSLLQDADEKLIGR